MKHDTWNARTFTDKVIKSAVQKEIETLALVVLGNNELKIDYCKDGFESNIYCDSTYKSFCPSGKSKKYRGSWRNYVVMGQTKTDVYLEVLRCLANDSSLYIPITDYRYEPPKGETE